MTDVTRRHFLQVLAVGAASTTGILSACSGQNNGSPEAFGDVVTGNVSQIQSGTVQSVPGHPIFVGRDSGGLYAMTTTCTHQGCDMATGQVINTDITCQCHGSVFDLNGGVVHGPANAPLTHFAVSVAADGSITVHGGETVSASTRTAVT